MSNTLLAWLLSLARQRRFGVALWNRIVRLKCRVSLFMNVSSSSFLTKNRNLLGKGANQEPPCRNDLPDLFKRRGGNPRYRWQSHGPFQHMAPATLRHDSHPVHFDGCSVTSTELSGARSWPPFPDRCFGQPLPNSKSSANLTIQISLFSRLLPVFVLSRTLLA